MVNMLKCDWVSQQTHEASNSRFVTIRNGRRIPVWMAFRCLYCGEYFNQAGAEKHFGKTRIEFNKNAHTESHIEVRAVEGK